ncbi:MAG: hypothetical protein J7K73_00465 [Nanoarchaeota archaeon]|nr:hypothetical protein [Nanoarchaeota archaeon]
MGEDWFEKLSKKFDARYLIAIPLITIPTLLFTKLMVVLLLFAATFAVSYFGQKTKLKKFGLELATFTTIITGVSFGAIPGIIAGVLTILFHDLLTGRISLYLVVVVPTFGLIGAIASVYPHTNLLVLGVGLTIFSHLIFITFQTLLHRFPARYMPYFALNVIFNALLFYNIAPTIIKILT